MFRGLSLALQSGDVLHIEGANGIGKTSLLRILAGLLPPFAGTVEHEGAIGLMDDRPALDPNLPVGKALAFWSRIDGVGEAGDIARGMMLTDLLDVPVRYLSTGQRKRAALARLLGQNSPIWLLDEPLSGLDEASRGLVAELVSDHSAAGGIAVIASHQPIAVERFEVFALAEYVL